MALGKAGANDALHSTGKAGSGIAYRSVDGFYWIKQYRETRYPT
jgi:hypothetical protein